MTSGGRWIETVDLSPEDAAQRLGLEVRRRQLAPCPACGEDRRGSAGTYTGRDGRRRWKCHRCGAGGDVVDLVAWSIRGGPLSKLDAEGKRAVRDWFVGPMVPATVRSSPVARTSRPERPAPSPSDVAAFVDALVPVTEDAEVVAFLRRRGVDAVAVRDLRLAFALPRAARIPPWAWTRGRCWTAGWRCVLPTFDARGHLRSVRARWVPEGERPKGWPKDAVPTGQGSATGSVLANAAAHGLLAEGGPPPERGVVIAEGAMDYLSWAVQDGARGWALFGVWSGAWTDDIAARVPDDALVVVRTHADTSGDDYARRIFETLVHRCDVRRATAESGRDDDLDG